MPESIEISTIKDGDFEMDYARIGGGKRIFLMLPGLSLTPVTPAAPTVAAQYASALTDYTIYLFDRRKNVSAGYSCMDMADDTVRAMDILGIGSAYIFGVSQGGMIAQCIAIHYPQYADKLLLASTNSRGNETSKAVFEKWLELAKNGDRRSLNRSFARSIYTPEYLEKYADAFAAMEEQGTDGQLEQFVIFLQACIDFGVYDELCNIKCPVMVIGAEDDRVLTAAASTEIAEKLGCACYIYEHYGHAVYDEAPDYLSRVLEFFNR